MPTATLTVTNPRQHPLEAGTVTVVGGTSALSDSSDTSYAEFTYAGSGNPFPTLLVDVAGSLPSGAQPSRYTVRLRVSSTAGIGYWVDMATGIDTYAYTQFYMRRSGTAGAGGPTDVSVQETTLRGGDDSSFQAQLAAGSVQLSVYPSSAGTLRVFEIAVDVDYGFVTPTERIYNLEQTRQLLYDRDPSQLDDPPDWPQPWSVLTSEGTTPAGEPVITGQFATESRGISEYDFDIDASETYAYNQDIGWDQITAGINVKRFRDTASPLPRTVRMRLYAHWLNFQGPSDPPTNEAGGSWTVYVLATTSFTPNMSALGSDVSTFWFHPGSLGTWTVIQTLTATGSTTNQNSPRPSWLADYNISTTPTVTHYGTIGGQPYADVQFVWNTPGNLSVAVVDDYWLNGTAPPFPLGNAEWDGSSRTITGYVDLWPHTGGSQPLLRVVSADGSSIWRVTATTNPDGGIMRLVEADGTRWKQSTTGTRPLTLVDETGAVRITLPMALEP